MENKKRLVDANKLIDFIDVGHLRHPGELCYSEVDVANILLHAPTINAVEVVHGRWKEMHYEGGILDGTNFDRCSVCGYERVFNDPALKTVFKYCPNCGAKMDSEG